MPRETVRLRICYDSSMGKNNLYSLSTELEIKNFLASSQDWTYEDNKLEAAYTLPDFGTAVQVMNKIFEVAIQMDHHPRLTNTYNRLELSLCTHSAGDKVTSFDIELARKISEITLKI